MFYKTKILLLLLVLSVHSYGGKPFKQELWWAAWHPFAAIKIKKIQSRVFIVYNNPAIKIATDSFSNGGKLDAFRHTFFMAAFAQKIKIKKLRKLGIAHEKGNYYQFLKHKNEEGEIPDSLGSVMDLTNNELGFKIGSENKKVNYEALKELTLQEIKSGKAVIIKRSPSGKYMDCNNKTIDLGLYKQKWFIPKCLISSGPV